MRKSIFYYKELTLAEVGKTGTHEIYVRLPNNFDYKAFFHQDAVENGSVLEINFSALDITNGRLDASIEQFRFVYFANSNKEKRLPGLGPLFKKYDIQSGDVFFLESREENGKLSFEFKFIEKGSITLQPSQIYFSDEYEDEIESEKHLPIDKPSQIQQIFNITPILESILSTGLIYSPILIKRLAFSLMAKPFVILSGLAGSGKTQLALAFAKCLSENIEEQVCTVSIGADWTNREPLLGYPNALNKDEYVKPESGVLQLLMRANEDPDKPYFLILDEMNLSVVERYFADFLSAMESGEPIKLWNNEKGNVPKEIELPKNVFIIGTINVDETTYMFSPKVLDRANVIEFKIAADEMEDYLGKKVNINLEQAYSACADMAVNFVTKAKSQVEKDEKNKDVLLSFFKELKEVNAEFGYRTVNEISRYLYFNDDDENGIKGDEAIDTAIVQKLLPKLHGSRKKLEPVLKQLWKLCFTGADRDLVIAKEHVEKARFKESADKIRRMYESVYANGFTSFAEA